MLLRKQRQLRRAADARALLEIGPRASPEEARRALRRLAHVVHPDRFGAAEDAAVRSASREVMTALVDAQRRLEEG
jgi:curved DNA-binding protein CbpA